MLPGLRVLFLVLLVLPAAAYAATRVYTAPVPAEMRSSAFTLTVNGHAVDVAHAAARYEFASFDITGPAEIAITAVDPHYWDRGVDIEPWRLGLRAERDRKAPQTIRFKVPGPVKLSISRPGDFLNHAQMLFLFAGSPPAPPPSGANVHIIPAGVHRESLNPQSGDTFYLAPGAFVFGSLNLWNVENVKVLGRGTIVYEGEQSPVSDDGWMQKPDWHCVGAFQSHNVQIDGLTCIIRSRTWSIQMKDSTGFTYDDLRVIGGNPGNANQDGMDWLGGGDAVVRNSFLRASDDVFAMQGNWDGYSDEDMLRPGHDVQKILIENSELSTSISNIVRAGWPQKIYNSSNFTLRDSDVLHAGIGACGQSFGIFGFWGANGARGDHTNINFENLFLDNWYSLAQIEQEEPSIRGVTFRNIWALGQPSLVPSTLTGDVAGVTFDNVKYGQERVDSDATVPLSVSGGAASAKFVTTHTPTARFSVDPPFFAPHQKVTFTAQAAPHARYTWLFGDGTQDHGRRAHHRFPDANGTDLDGANGAGRFRVLLHVEDKEGRQDWAEQDLVAVEGWHSALNPTGALEPGLDYAVYPGNWTALPNLASQHAIFAGTSSGVEADAQGFTHYAVTWDGFLDVPADGGYIFALMDRDGARLVIDGMEVAKTGPPFAQVCGSPGNAARYRSGWLGLRAGRHSLHIEGLFDESGSAPILLWQAPGQPLMQVPATAFSHSYSDIVGKE
ncbi:MAG TPA: PA14 domain-containing protein [Terracidiphilus sp.]|nr:PA14 domain-containing protein [Terracidiphilus sp.]